MREHYESPCGVSLDNESACALDAIVDVYRRTGPWPHRYPVVEERRARAQLVFLGVMPRRPWPQSL